MPVSLDPDLDSERAGVEHAAVVRVDLCGRAILTERVARLGQSQAYRVGILLRNATFQITARLLVSNGRL